MNCNSINGTSTRLPSFDRNHVVAACITLLTREVHAAGLETQDALNLLRDAPDKIEAALTRGPRALVLYRLDANGARGVVGESNSQLQRFVAVAKQDSATVFGFCPAVIADLAAHIEAGAASLRKDA